MPPCLFGGRGLCWSLLGARESLYLQWVFARIRLLLPVAVYDLGLQSVIEAPSLPSFPNWSLVALVKSHGASFHMKNILKAWKSENARVWLSGTMRSCGVTWSDAHGCVALAETKSRGWDKLFEEDCFQLNQYCGCQQRFIKAINWKQRCPLERWDMLLLV